MEHALIYLIALCYWKKLFMYGIVVDQKLFDQRSENTIRLYFAFGSVILTYFLLMIMLCL
jgi:hypothetical protein